jgi:amino acid adenylation domain-containing protein
LVELFQTAVAECEEAPCVSFGGRLWTYREIDRWSEAIAAAINDRSSLDRVTSRAALVVKRGPQIVAGMMGVLKASAAFVPVDPAQPIERSRMIVEDAQPDQVVTDVPEFVIGELGVDPRRVVDVHRLADHQSALRQSRCNIDTFSPAYVTYTSGSTGRPKGVICTHAGACNLADVQIERFSLTRSARVSATTSIGFDASMAEICMALRTGAVLAIADEAASLSGAALASFLVKERISHLVITPTLLATLPRRDFPDLKLISIGGEPTPEALVAYWSQRVALDNAFGPTETSIEVAHWRFSPDDPGNRIGKPIHNARFDVRGLAGEPADEGELWIGGPMVALGYLGQPELSAKRFFTCPTTGLRFYRSGDRVRHNGQGVYDFLGRIDEQIKISGVRIEPEEVRRTIETIPGVLQVAVVTEEGQAGPRLVAYYKVSSEMRDRVVLMEEVSRRLPPAMIPARLVAVEAIPMLVSGKVDVGALARQAADQKVTSDATSASALSRAVRDLWCEILNVADVKPTDNFFELGGDSLRLTQLIFAINKTYRVRLTPAVFRTLDHLGALIAHVEEALASSNGGAGARRQDVRSASNTSGVAG